MPVSRLHVLPDVEPLRRLAPADRIGLSVISGELSEVRGYATAGLEHGARFAEPQAREGDPIAGATATPPSSVATLSNGDALVAAEGRATVTGPLGPVRAARWNAQLPASAAGAPAGVASSPNAEATSS